MQRITKPPAKRTRPVRKLSTAVRSPAKAKAEPDIAQGVKLGYQLVDEYLEAGRAAAAQLREPPPSAQLSESERLAQRLVRYTSDFASVGLELLSALAKPAAQPPPTGNAGPFGVPHSVAPQPVAAGVALEIASSRRVRASIELTAQPLGALIAHDLRCSGSDVRIRPLAVAYDAARQCVSASICVPDDAPAGDYHAALIDAADNLPRGRLWLHVS
ncbi:MAG TPA: hypothetical protein VJR89_43350 [Polyangiales bacterium]|nr:hypothetical protein [Polyangiales bacterium]